MAWDGRPLLVNGAVYVRREGALVVLYGSVAVVSGKNVQCVCDIFEFIQINCDITYVASLVPNYLSEILIVGSLIMCNQIIHWSVQMGMVRC